MNHVTIILITILYFQTKKDRRARHFIIKKGAKQIAKILKKTRTELQNTITETWYLFLETALKNSLQKLKGQRKQQPKKNKLNKQQTQKNPRKQKQAPNKKHQR